MDAAYLHNEILNIEKQRVELEQSEWTRDEIRKWFEDRYRVFSKKGAFTCLCCHKPVNMNLTKDDGRPFYFRHNDESECSYSENTRTYESHLTRMESRTKKDVGLTLFREILTGMLKAHDIDLERGYQFRKKLSFVPDFIIRFPDSDQVWAIDYFTALEQGLRTGSYAKHLSKRMKSYDAEGIKSLAFVDISWVSYLKETNKGTLLTAEKHLRQKTKEDMKWDQFLETQISGGLKTYLQKDAGVNIDQFDTKSMIYTDVSNQTFTIYRHLQSQETDRNLTVYTLTDNQVPVNQSLRVNINEKKLELIEEDEQNLREGFLAYLTNRKKQHDESREKEQKRLRDEQLKQEEEEGNRRREAVKQYYLKPEKFEASTGDSEGEYFERKMRERARRAAKRPVDKHPDYWSPSYDETSLFESPSVVEGDKPSDEKREELKRMLLTHPLPGDRYIDQGISEWRVYLLKWIKKWQSDVRLVVSKSQLIQDMKNEGFTFNQSDAIIVQLIEDFFNYYQKMLKVKLKRSVELVWME